MKQFDSLLAVADRLLGKEGCPWDQKQTFLSLQPYLLEEAHEVVEAVDLDHSQKMIEELGDLLYIIIFYAKLAERENRFSFEDVVKGVQEKLIRRHPHIFGEGKVKNAEEVAQNWEKIKKQEKAGLPSSENYDPPTLPTLLKAQKFLKRLLRTGSLPFAEKPNVEGEEMIGYRILSIILEAEQQGIDVESALRRFLMKVQK